MPRQTSPPRNHPSATERLNVLRKNIRKEQDLGRCIVVDRAVAKFWPELFLSPFGVVDKGNSDPDVAGRVIHDLSFPEGASVNDHTDAESVPTAEYTHCAAIAREILAQKERFPGRSIKILLGDVAAAFRNLGTHSQSTHLFAGTIPEDDALIIDLSACFGWTGSPGFYGVIGDAIAHIHGTTSNTYDPNGFFNYHWVDDHVCIAADVGSNCTDVEQSLRSAMTLILGPDAVNDDKFTPWATSQKVLGLVFDTIAGTISIPADKIVKARALVTDAYNSRALSRKRYRSLLGSLRHVATCVRPAKAFLQRLRAAESKLHRWTSVPMTPHMREDLAWWRVILNSPTLNGVPLEYFRHNPPCDFTIEMDASDTGLCALDRAHRRVLTYRFSETEQNLIRVFNTDACNEFDINYRELLSCAFAVHAWAPAWRVKNMETPHTTPTHVHFRIDNTSAVAWQNKMSSSNTRAQTIIRLLSYWEMHYGLRFSSSQIPGADNAIADAGSRQSKDHHSAHNRHQWSGADLARYLREHSVADSTYRKYERAFGTWQAFITRRGVNPWLSGVPAVAQVQHVSDFILMGFQQGYGSGRPVRSATIANNLMGVRHFFQASGRHFPVDHPQVRMLLKGISRLDSPPERKAPVSIQLMEACFASLNLASFSDQALWGVLCLAFFFLLRRSEITSVSGGKFRWFALKAQDVAVLDRAGNATLDASAAITVHIRLRGSKTNQAGQATTRMLRRSGHRFLCPVLGALLLLQSRRSLPGELPVAMYMPRSGEPSSISARQVANTIQDAAKRIGGDPREYSTHSLRSGGATHMYRAGVDALTIQFHGRWASDTFKIYTRLCRESVSRLAASMVSGAKSATTLQ